MLLRLTLLPKRGFICIISVGVLCNWQQDFIMNDDNLSARRRRRVNRIKIYIITLFIVLLITPTIVSIYAMNRLKEMNRSVEDLQDKLDKVELTYLLKTTAKDSLDDIQHEEIMDEAEAVEEYTLPIIDERDLPEGYRSVYLTFDDGPSIYTTQILDILDSYGVKATFFVTAAQKDNHPEWYKEIVDRGHSIGMHSYSHVYNSVYASQDSFFDDVDKIHDVVLETTGVDCKLYRFPGGSSNHVSTVSMSDLCGLIHERGYEYFDWNISSQDASNPPPGTYGIINNVLSGIDKFDNCIVLLHDAGDKYSTVQALPSIIEGIQKRDKTVILPITEHTEAVWHVDATMSSD